MSEPTDKPESERPLAYGEVLDEMDHERKYAPANFPPADRALLARVSTALVNYHVALDMAFARLIKLDDEFFPSKSAMWPAMVEGDAVRKAVNEALSRMEPGP